MPHHTIIYNPAAAQGLAGERIEEVKSRLEEAGIDFTLVLTSRPGHAIELARDAACEAVEGRAPTDVIVAAGGDGTANEVINGMMRALTELSRETSGAKRGADGDESGRYNDERRPFPALGVLSVGRGNDFAYGAGIPTTLDGCIELLEEGHRKALDVGHLRGGDYPDGRYFGNGIGVGFDTIVGLEAARMKRIRGFAAYLFAAFKTLLFYYKTPRLRMQIDSEVTTMESIQVSVMNGRRLGGAFFMAPDAQTGDGLFDLCIAGKPRRGQMLALLLKYMGGSQAKSAHITTGRARSVTISAEDGTMAVHADGETICTAGTEIAFECVPSALEVVTDHQFPETD